jgi:hypothetical protein
MLYSNLALCLCCHWLAAGPDVSARAGEHRDETSHAVVTSASDIDLDGYGNSGPGWQIDRIRGEASSRVPGREPTLIETDDGHAIALSLRPGRVSLDWSGPRHADLTADTARSLGFVLRGYARLLDLSHDTER